MYQSMAKLCTQWRILKPPVSLLLAVLRRLFWCNCYFMLIGVGVLCRISYHQSIVSYLYVYIVKRELLFLLSFTFNYVVSVWFLG